MRVTLHGGIRGTFDSPAPQDRTATAADPTVVASPNGDLPAASTIDLVFSWGTLDEIDFFGPTTLPADSGTVFIDNSGQTETVDGVTYYYQGLAYEFSYPLAVTPPTSGAVIASGTVDFGNGNGSLTDASLQQTTFGAATVANINGPSSWRAYFDNTLGGTIDVGGAVSIGGTPVGQPAADPHGATSELDLLLLGDGSVQNSGTNGTLALSDYVPTTTNTGTIDIESGSEMRIEIDTGALDAGESADGTDRFLVFAGQAAFDNEGTIDVNPGGGLLVYESGNKNAFVLSDFVNNGQIDIQGAAGSSTGALVQGYLTGSGTITVDGGNATDPSTTLLHLNAIVDSNIVVRDATVQATDTGSDGTNNSDGAEQHRAIGGTFTFADGHGSLEIDPSTSDLLAGTTPFVPLGPAYETPSLGFWNMPIEGFQAGDTIVENIYLPLNASLDTYAIAPLAWDAATHILSIEVAATTYLGQPDGTTTVGELNLVGNYSSSDLSESVNAGSNGYNFNVAITTTAAACFAAGTRIATTRGALPVETLIVGDEVLLAQSAGATRTVVWLGYRHVACRGHPSPPDVWPVRVAAGAFGLGRPERDLLLSPDHAVFIDGVLIPVRHLIDGRVIVRELRDTVTYWHVELDRHDVILAEGLPCESFLDTGNRAAFENGGQVIQMHADFAKRLWDADSCAPLVIVGPQIDRVRARLARPVERAERHRKSLSGHVARRA